MKGTSFVFTPEGIKALGDETEQLKVQRQARASETQSGSTDFLDERIQELQTLIEDAVIAYGPGPSDHSIETGAAVKLRDLQFEEDLEYTVVNRFEADPLQHKLSEESPLGKALISKKAGE